MDIKSQDATRPYTKTKKQESVTQQVQQEQSSPLVEEKRGTREGIRGAPLESLVSVLERCARDIQKRAERILAISYGGQAYAGGPDYRGDPIDSISEGMFSIIIAMSEDATPYYDLDDAIAELSHLLTVERGLGMSQGGQA